MNEPVAIVGSACRFPGSTNSISQLWDLLKDPRDLIREFPGDRLQLKNFYDPDGSRPGYTNVQNNQSYLLSDDCAAFDASFFRINNKEAHAMDPQQRNLLETSYEALEAAGWTLEKVQGSSMGVYVGAMTADYNDMHMRDPAMLQSYAATGLARSMLANRISYFFDLQGPSVTIDTACSSSLVALHHAIQGLRAGDGNTAIVAGTAMLLDPGTYIAESKLQMLSPDGRSRMWDHGANGRARGEGCAVILIKPLSQAIRDHDDIESIIRETCVGSDGRTNGITMPSSSAQKHLIEKTYKRAGLNVVKDRCQYFECHGTGTPAGDPVEAQAIKEAFFPTDPQDEIQDGERHASIHCGSIKTIIGHLEGCAGLAGILKASLAVQKGFIPPNMHFERLHPAIKPYYDHLCVPTSLIPWPPTYGEARRASVNSFGFGGTNAHAILESPPADLAENTDSIEDHRKMILPTVFSAKSRYSLVTALRRMTAHLKRNPNLDLDALSWTLLKRRTAHSLRTYVQASNRNDLIIALENLVNLAEGSPDMPFGVQLPTRDPGVEQKLLGVFTGQGAQWVSMGLELVTHCPLFRAALEHCESALASLPNAPSWSLTRELAANSEYSRVSEAEISQPLLTALQIALVDLLRFSGIHFDAVVGHSSGEIGAAYAAGVLTTRDAIGIAYYRGLVIKQLVISRSGERQGAMMAVGIPLQKAKAFCSQPQFAGRIGVAACNAPSSVTLSGDLDAITEAQAIFDRDQEFARLLNVDTAYHSNHMEPCEESYTQYLEAMDIKPQTQRNGCIWFSSVQGHEEKRERELEPLKARYWVENMVNPVMFSQALHSTVAQCSSVAAAIEVGPHPALRNPVEQTLKSQGHANLPYRGCLQRGKSDIESLSSALGMLWCHFVPCHVKFNDWRKAFHRHAPPRALKGLPSYSWDHNRAYWSESRISNELRLGTTGTDGLLGRPNQILPREMTWRNVFRQVDLPWLSGHSFQGQVVFPGAGYISMAVQAAQKFVHGRAIKTIELHDVNIANALVVGKDGMTVETIFTFRSHDDALDTPKDSVESVLEAEFTCHSCVDGRKLKLNCQGRISIHYGQVLNGVNLQWSPNEDELPPLDVDRFHTSLSALGITYSGAFRALKSMSRIWGIARATAMWEAGALDASYSLHPAILDLAFQTAFATFSSIAHKSMTTTFLPSKIKHVVIDPQHRFLGTASRTEVGIDAHLIRCSPTANEIDVNVFDPRSSSAGILVNGLVLQAISEPRASDDRLICANTSWAPDISSGFPCMSPAASSSEELQCIESAERTALFYLRNLEEEIRLEEIPQLKPHHQALMRGIKLLLSPVKQGRHAHLKKEWLEDTWDDMDDVTQEFPDSVEISLLKAVGENLPSVLRGKTDMLEHMLRDDLLSRLYTEGRGFVSCNEYVADFMQHISHKYPRLHILEIGAGTGGTTSCVLDSIGDAYAAYTYTDISSGFFEKAASKFGNPKITFRALNIESSPSEQGYKSGSCDVVIAANVLHATRCLEQTVRHVRSLLRPGGFLIMVEVTGTMLRETGLMGGLEGWWLGMDEGRFPSPGISETAWDGLLRKCGFSGVDTIKYDLPDLSKHNCSSFITQAVDDRIELLRQPLTPTNSFPILEGPILIVGGKTPAVSQAVNQLRYLLRVRQPRISTCLGFEDVDVRHIAPGTSLISLAELDESVFTRPLNSAKVKNVQELVGEVSTMLWITSGGPVHDPFQCMMTGVGRSLAHELPHVQMQFINFDGPSSWDMKMVATYFLRLTSLTLPQFQNCQADYIWAHEPEIDVRGGTAFIPRIVPDQDANARVNAVRRGVATLAKPSERIGISYASTPPTLQGRRQHGLQQNSTQIDVELSVPIHSPGETSRFLCFGRLQGTATNGVALVDEDCSTSFVDLARIFQVPSTSSFDQSGTRTLVAIGACLIASHIISSSPEHGTILVHQPPGCVAAALTESLQLRGQSLRCVFITSTPDAKRHGWTFVHPLAQPRTTRTLIPLDTAAVWRFSHVNVDNILSLLSKDCVARRFEPESITRQSEDIASAYELAERISLDISPLTTSIHELHSIQTPEDRLANVIQWQRAKPVTVSIPPTTSGLLFSPDRTYLLVGMTGELGQSLCRFMVPAGARNIVLASRNPKSRQNWVENLRKSGVNIRMVKMNVANEQQVHDTVATIRQGMPKIAGVANAALVLEDSLFVNTSIKSIEKQLGPKVDGTIHLDHEFASDALDFFILFSSLGTVYGNPGQAIYHATNMFVNAFAARRQSRGQAASVINIGMISDVGYVAKSERTKTHIEGHLRSLFYTPLSESEFHNLFVQAIYRGTPGSTNEQLTMGMEEFIDDPDVSERPSWYSNPRFSHMVVPPTHDVVVMPHSSTSQNWRQRLETATSESQAAEAFQTLFCRKLESLTQAPPDSINIAGPLSDLGLDSLLAVEIRTWLLNEVGIEVPLLGILGEESITSITPKVVQRYLGHSMTVCGESFPQEPSSSALPSSRSHRKADESCSEVSPDHVGTSDEQLSSTNQSSHGSEINTGSLAVRSGTVSPSEYSMSPDTMNDASGVDCREHPLLRKPMGVNKYHVQDESRVFTDTAPASFAQSGVFFLDTFLDSATTFNVTAHYTIEGPLDIDKFSEALEKALNRHDTYKTCFFIEPGIAGLRQGVLQNINGAKFAHVQCAEKKRSHNIFRELSEHHWDLAKGDTFRAILVTHSPDSHSLLVGCHHIIMDGISWHILLRDLDHEYRMASMGETPSPYIEFCRRQTEALRSGAWDKSKIYWLHQLDPIPDALPLLPLARRRHRVPQQTYETHVIQQELSPRTGNDIKLASRSCRATPMQFHLAVIQTIFANMLGLTDMCIGIVHTGRMENAHSGPSISDTVGHFTNLLPTRFKINQEGSFAELLSATTGVVLNGLSHAAIPFEHILESLGIQRSLLYMPLFQVVFNYRVGDLLQRDLGDCSLALVRYSDAKTPYDVTFTVTQTSDGGQLLEVGCNANLYSQAATEVIAGVYVSLLQELATDTSRKVKECVPRPVISEERAPRPDLDTTYEDTWPDTLIERFQQVCASLPDSIAISDAGSSITYQQLACQVRGIATALMHGNGIKRGAVVAVLCESSVDMYSALLAILHIGAIYFPLDPSLPTSRMQAMMDACSPTILLFHEATVEPAGQLGNRVAALDLSSLQSRTSNPSMIEALVEDEAFLLFTSGSTGVPKGVRLTQTGIMNYADGKKSALALRPGLKVLQQSSPGFDMSIAQFANAICNGGTLVIAPTYYHGDPVAIADLMFRESISLTICTPSQYLLLATHAVDALRRCVAWRHACSGGEILNDGVFDALKRLNLVGLTLTDCYGPSEVSCAVTLRSAPISSCIQETSVGRPIANMTIYVLDDDGNRLPTGYPGEICVGGRGVARGYLDEKHSTGKFIRDPFIDPDDVSRGFGVMYKTGDRGCLRKDGSLVLLGRVSGDTMVKLRGFRIELDEVAISLVRAAGGRLSDAVVGIRGDPEFLVAYVVKSPDHDLTQSELHELVAGLPLPRYMIPSTIVSVERLPTTLNGKVDRGALAAVALREPDQSTTNAKSSLTVAEEELRLLWLHVLGDAAGLNCIVADTDFFAIGGTSLVLVRLQEALCEKMGVRIPLQDLYRNSTLRFMALAASEERGRVVTDTIDWAAETSIAHIMDDISQELRSPRPKKVQRHVVLTGATGFLGSEILKALLADVSVATVHCVAVPADQQHRILPDPRVNVYVGSLASPTLGLSALEVDKLQYLIDQVIHAGSQGHCLNNYSTVRKANYLSTQFLTSLALPRRVPMHFISSPRVILLSQSVDIPPVSMAAYPPPTDGSQGFTASKWASECFLEAVSRCAQDFPVVVHRPCSVVGALAPPDDALNAVVRYSRLSYRVPDVPGTKSFFDFRDAAEVASEIVRGPLCPTAESSDTSDSPDATQCLLSFRHHSSGVKVPFSQLASRMGALYGGDFEKVPMAEWIETATRFGIESVIVSYLKANMSGEATLTFPYMGSR